MGRITLDNVLTVAGAIAGGIVGSFVGPGGTIAGAAAGAALGDAIIPDKSTSEASNQTDPTTGLTVDEQKALDEQAALAEQDLYTQLGLQQAGTDAQNALAYMTQWQKTVDTREESAAQGLPPPPGLGTTGSVFDNSGSENWDQIDDILHPDEDKYGGRFADLLPGRYGSGQGSTS